MGPMALEMWNESADVGRDLLLGAQHVLVSQEFSTTAQAIIEDTVTETGGLPTHSLLFEGRLPGETTVIEIQGFKCLFIARAYSENEVDYVLKTPGFKGGLRGTFIKKTQDISVLYAQSGKPVDGDRYHAIAGLCLHYDFILSLMAEPRLAKSTPPPRSFRRQARRVLGLQAPARWDRISWTVGDEVAPSSKRAEKLFRQPLHYCRAHWRRTHENAPKAEVRRGHDGHWCWVQGCFRGHPDYGVKLSTYEPHIDPIGSSAPAIAALSA